MEAVAARRHHVDREKAVTARARVQLLARGVRAVEVRDGAKARQLARGVEEALL